MSEVDGATLVARSLKRQGVNFMFGIVGFPVGPIAAAAQKEGITYVGMRNEQSASYAAQAVGYLTGRPGACLVVSGPGVVHALSGLANAQQNRWPMVLIGGASESWRNGMGAFQEERQVLIATPFCKFAHAVEHVHRIPFYVEMAVRNSIYGRPGATYLEMPDDIITGKVDEARVEEPARCPDPPRTQAVPEDVERPLDALRSAERPLVIVGKGMAWHASIAEKAAANAAQIAPQLVDDAAPANYYRALKDVAAWAPEDAVIIGEGASTMDIGRTQLFNAKPRHRLDAGSYGTMGIGMGFVIAAAVVHPDKPIISVSGDSAIGFSGMEMETVCRYQLPVKIVVFNNGGMGPGHAKHPDNPLQHLKPNALIYC